MNGFVNCWSVLGLDSDADERSIKRPYAKLLKTNRPDEDPAAFQRLREAYEQAIAQARNRSEVFEEATPTAPQAETAAAPPVFYGTVEPAPSREGIERAVLDGVTPANIAEQWQQATERGYDVSFQQQMMLRCLRDPWANLAFLAWGAAHLQWLTPWQSVPINPAQQQLLADILLDHLLDELCGSLELGEERAFLQRLDQHLPQPWLRGVDQRVTLQVRLLELFAEQPHWSPALFDRVCQRFGWGDDNAAVPVSDALWHSLLERCKQPATPQPAAAAPLPAPPDHRFKRLGLVIYVALVLQMLGRTDLGPLIIMLPLTAVLAWLGVLFSKFLLDLWAGFSEKALDLDQWLSARAIPARLQRGQPLLLLRDGLPYLAFGWLMWKWLGLLGVATCLLVPLIGRLQGAAAQPQPYTWRKPLQALSRITGWSTLQWLVAVGMVGVMGYCQLYLAGFPLTRGSEG
jgi:hypothetical protein